MENNYQGNINIYQSKKEPYNKNDLWFDTSSLDLKIFNKGWKVLASLNDAGLSPKSISELEDKLNNLKSSLMKQIGKQSLDYLNIVNQNRELKVKVARLEQKIDRIMKKLNAIQNG